MSRTLPYNAMIYNGNPREEQQMNYSNSQQSSSTPFRNVDDNKTPIDSSSNMSGKQVHFNIPDAENLRSEADKSFSQKGDHNQKFN